MSLASCQTALSRIYFKRCLPKAPDKKKRMIALLRLCLLDARGTDQLFESEKTRYELRYTLFLHIQLLSPFGSFANNSLLAQCTCGAKVHECSCTTLHHLEGTCGAIVFFTSLMYNPLLRHLLHTFAPLHLCTFAP